MFSTHRADVSERACCCAHLAMFCPTTARRGNCGNSMATVAHLAAVHGLTVTLQTHVKVHPTKICWCSLTCTFILLNPNSRSEYLRQSLRFITKVVGFQLPKLLVHLLFWLYSLGKPIYP